VTMIPDKGIREMIWPTNDATPTVYVPNWRETHFGPITDSQIQPASLDVRLNHDFILHPSGERLAVGPDGYYVLQPGDCVLASLVERLDMRSDNVAARIEGKSSWARKFLTVHSAGFIDPGFTGDVTLELKNDGKLWLELHPGMLIAQISFHFLSAPAERLYGEPGLKSHYQGQIGTTEAQDGQG
jgi:dCTP deaminase